jgi:phytoene synthase
VALARQSLQKHARSFRIAARFLGNEEADDAAICYAFCRDADDRVDEAPSFETARSAITELQAELSGQQAQSPLVGAFCEMAQRRHMPLAVAHTLVETIAADAGPVRIADDAALIQYAYGVAGTVGVMMAYLLGAQSERALASAIDLGIGMQLSNVARDVREDAARNRVYLPMYRLYRLGISPEAVVAGQADPQLLAQVCQDLVEMAEPYYASALDGLRYLAIGQEVVRRGVEAFERRTVLGRVRLGGAMLRGIAMVLHPRVWGALRPHNPQLHSHLADILKPGVLCPTV